MVMVTRRARSRPTIGRMTIQRMDHVGVVVDDLADAVAFFVELGLELQGEAPVEGDWVDRIIGLEDVRAQIAMLQTPDGQGRLELTKFHTPPTDGGQQARLRTLRAFATLRSRSTTSTPCSLACAPAAQSSSASWGATGTATDSAMSAAPRGSSSSWLSRSADRSELARSRQRAAPAGGASRVSRSSRTSAAISRESSRSLGAPSVICSRPT